MFDVQLEKKCIDFHNKKKLHSFYVRTYISAFRVLCSYYALNKASVKGGLKIKYVYLNIMKNIQILLRLISMTQSLHKYLSDAYFCVTMKK
jgi:hypothetical protein